MAGRQYIQQINNWRIHYDPKYKDFGRAWQVQAPDGRIMEDFRTKGQAVKFAKENLDFVSNNKTSKPKIPGWRKIPSTRGLVEAMWENKNGQVVEIIYNAMPTGGDFLLKTPKGQSLFKSKSTAKRNAIKYMREESL